MLVDIETIVRDTKTSLSAVKLVLNKFQNNNFDIIDKKIIKINSYERIMLAVKAVEAGTDIETVTKLLHWKEFEGISALALERNNFSVKKNFRFTFLKKRNEIDVIGLKKPIVLCIDCKHWLKEINYSSLKKIVPNQIKRTKNLTKYLPNIYNKLECTSWEHAIFVPAILSLVSNRQKFYDSVPIIPILKFQDFLNQLLGNMHKIKFLEKRFNHL